ncbi:T9SS type A sorting domain-containing protein [Hymenobacter terrestris]|uniref:T9SS type A sorting domain-containing protein n=1 Tax=Hymenobacter terrestris TaxID=2748310 RepID=A0ABX2PZ58_9BACT|nr:T9SS type A sorting domain-containing protein [Hymenobacter terrestris]NVO83456.1 T9SS type A sorting domain-containing protein [Hymenobacter terrestris]
MKKLVLPIFLAAACLVGGNHVALAQTVCPAAPTPVSVAGNITTNTTWTRTNIYLLADYVNVKSGATLTIEPGTIILGRKETTTTKAGTLIIERGARLIADGTATQPIVFTSNQPAGSRNRGDWGGIVLLGNAPVNQTNPIIEGGINQNYGGTDAADNSGILRYVRIEFSGIALLPNNEINGLTMGGVGSGTIIDYVQVSNNGDDSFEWFGGTVNAKHLVSSGATDDDFDTDFGYSGKVQYGLIIRNPDEADVSGSTAFESDNDGQGSAFTPITSPVFSNITAILPNPIGATANFTRALHLRRNTSISIFNSVFAGWPIGLTLDGAAAQANATSGSLSIKNTVLAGMTTNNFQAAGVTTYDVAGYFNAADRANQTVATATALNLNADNFQFVGNTAANYLLPANSPLVSGGAFTDAKLADAFFDKTGTYRGAFPAAATAGATNWAAGWTNFNPQITCYNRAGLTLATKSASDQLQQLAVVPNPSNGPAELRFNLKRGGAASVRVFDLTGRQVATVLVDSKLNTGDQALRLPTNLKAGVYMATVTTTETSQSVRFVVVR